jgi:hypothetical protein
MAKATPKHPQTPEGEALPTAVPHQGKVAKVVDPELVSQAVARFDWVLAFMTLNDRFNYEILGRCQRMATEAIDTMGVGPKGLEIALSYSPSFTARLEDEELRWVLSHEVLHVVFHHVTGRSPKDKTEARLDNTAADLAINSLLGTTGNGHNGKTPLAKEDIVNSKGVTTVKKGDPWVLTPAQFGWPERLSMDVYRELLRERYSETPEELEDIAEGREVDSHDGWEPSEVGDAQIRDWVDRIGASKNWGGLSPDTIAAITAAQRVEVSWDRELRWLLGRMDSSKRRHTLKKPSRRVGYPWSGTVKQYTDNPLFAPDTSGSVDDANLAKFLGELNGLARRRDVDFMSWSYGMTMDKPIRWDKRRTSLDFKGRGGTDPQPVIDYAAAHGYKQLILLTDGEFGTPVVPPRVHIVWVITCDGTTRALPEGSHVVQMTHKG